jgi:integrase
MMRFTLATGLRENNVVTLDWSQVDLEQRRAVVHVDQAKGRKRAIAVPLNAQAMVVLREQIGHHPTRVFCYEGATGHPCQQSRLAKSAPSGGHRGFPLA